MNNRPLDKSNISDIYLEMIKITEAVEQLDELHNVDIKKAQESLARWLDKVGYKRMAVLAKSQKDAHMLQQYAYTVLDKRMSMSSDEIKKAREEFKSLHLIESTEDEAELEENITEEKLSQSQISQLRQEYSKISKIDPSGASYKKLISLLDKLDKKALQDLVDAKIKFVSSLALNRVNRNESVESIEESTSVDSLKNEYKQLASARKIARKHIFDELQKSGEKNQSKMDKLRVSYKKIEDACTSAFWKYVDAAHEAKQKVEYFDESMESDAETIEEGVSDYAAVMAKSYEIFKDAQYKKTIDAYRQTVKMLTKFTNYDAPHWDIKMITDFTSHLKKLDKVIIDALHTEAKNHQ
jgi:hypothetical protein